MFCLLIRCLEVLPNERQGLELEFVKKLHDACIVFENFNSVSLVAFQGYLVIPPTGLI